MGNVKVLIKCLTCDNRSENFWCGACMTAWINVHANTPDICACHPAR